MRVVLKRNLNKYFERMVAVIGTFGFHRLVIY